MTSAAHAIVSTASGSRYLQQLCKHWSHRLAVSFDATHGEVTFPNGTLAVMDARPDGLDVRVEAPDQETLATMQKVVQEHLERFAFREAPLSFDWQAD